MAFGLTSILCPSLPRWLAQERPRPRGMSSGAVSRTAGMLISHTVRYRDRAAPRPNLALRFRWVRRHAHIDFRGHRLAEADDFLSCRPAATGLQHWRNGRRSRPRKIRPPLAARRAQ